MAGKKILRKESGEGIPDMMTKPQKTIDEKAMKKNWLKGLDEDDPPSNILLTSRQLAQQYLPQTHHFQPKPQRRSPDDL
jgi:hypothetical protein